MPLNNRNIQNKQPRSIGKASFWISCHTFLIVGILKLGMYISQFNHLRLSIGCKPPICLGTTNMLKKRPVPPVDGLVAPWPIAHQPPTGYQDNELKQLW